MQKLDVWIPLAARPQGSKTAVQRNGKIIMFESGKNLKKDRLTFSDLLRAVAQNQQWHIPNNTTPIKVDITCCFEKPATAIRKFHTIPPDADKLARFVLDACTDAGIWLDDSQVIELTIRKTYDYHTTTRIRITHD